MLKWMAGRRSSRNGSWMRISLVSGSLLLAAPGALAVDTLESAKISGPGEGAGLFGRSVATSGDTILVGAPFDSGGDTFSGSAYVYGFDGSQWTAEAEFDVAEAGDAFGFAVALEGSRSVIGAPTHAEAQITSGAVYIFDFDGQDWVQQPIVTADDAGEDDKFGSALALDVSQFLVGAPFDDDQASDAGAAYVFQFDGEAWTQQAKLTASDGGADDNFGGTSVAIDGNVAIVGAPLHDGNTSDTGAAYVFRFNGETWTQEAKLTASDAAGGDNFGFSVSVVGATAIVGAPFHDEGAVDSGAAYTFRFDGEIWVPQTKLTAPEAIADDNFGVSIDYDSELILVGAPRTPGVGSAYLFLSGVWNLLETLVPSDGSAGDDFGSAVAFFGLTSAVGAPFDDSAGSAYVFTLPEPSAQTLMVGAVTVLAGLARRRKRTMRRTWVRYAQKQRDAP